ncbi:unnamed protein product [[Candida] boidinii]|nr:hypothetical protein B5S27_g1529 [[Candida] boidinii]OWB69474.1 hypothetical protein B5S30_g4888 [[Candida] boidinii]OWB81976.1 hypothetical protein B5S33_g597 [[Candida] boidinii]GMF06185.1 unnamed protein product [[Candida] boidinii]
MTANVFTHTLTFKIPFENEKQASIACKTLSPDPILKPTELNVNYSNIENNLIIKFNGVSDRVIRVAANNVMENLKTVVECFEEF